MRFSNLIVFATIFCITGCASIISQSEYAVNIQSNVEGVNFTIRDEEGTAVHKGVTPHTVTLDASDGYFSKSVYNVEFEKAGTKTYMTISPDIDGWYFANILFGGVIGMLIVDPLTGAMYKLPEKISGHLDENQAANDGTYTLQFLTIADLSPEQIPHLQRIN